MEEARLTKKKDELAAPLTLEDKFNMENMKFAQGPGASLRYATELRAVQQTSRLPFLPSSKLHEDVLRGKLGPGMAFNDIFGQHEESRPSRLAFL